MNKVIKFSAKWCGPCKAMQPHFEKFQESVKDRGVEVVDLDVDKEHEVAEKYGVMSIPYTIFIKDGEVANSQKGMLTTDKLQSLYEKVYS